MIFRSQSGVCPRAKPDFINSLKRKIRACQIYPGWILPFALPRCRQRPSPARPSLAPEQDAQHTRMDRISNSCLVAAERRQSRLRVLNLIASIILIFYNWTLGAWPQVGMNAILVVINLWHLRGLSADQSQTSEPHP